MKIEFEWDEHKADLNQRKHGVTFAEADSVFDDPLFITVHDEEHSMDEDRFITIGLSDKDRLIIVAHADRQNRIRIFSARKATKNEQKYYEEAG